MRRAFIFVLAMCCFTGLAWGQSFTATPLEPVSRFHKQALSALLTADDRTGNAGQLEVVSLIVTYDESVDTRKVQVPAGKIVYRYSRVLNGISLVVPVAQVDKIAAQKNITGIYLDRAEKLNTDRSPEFIGAEKIWSLLGGQHNAGEGVLVGILDTGIWPEHPSFADPDPQGRPYPAPEGGPYPCDFGNTAFNPEDASFVCNNKLVGAYTFMDTYKLFNTLVPYDPATSIGEFDSARDSHGHGSHTASTAAGNGNVPSVILNKERGPISGIAPRAQIIAYRVCGAAAGCYRSDSLAATEQAIQDGVDVINFSISGGQNPFTDIVEQGFLTAYENGVFVAASAGNSGPGADTVGHRGPWVTTVAASLHDRTYTSSVSLTADNGGQLVLEGGSITAGYTAEIVMAADYGDGLCLAPFAEGTFEGQIVVCERGEIARVLKSYNVFAGGAGGLILYNPVVQNVVLDPHFVPAIHIQNDAGLALLDFLWSHTGVVGELSGGVLGTRQGDVMVEFSSRGGPDQKLGISKPDIAAPGVFIMAANTGLALDIADNMVPPGELFRFMSGTSMSSPHVAGAGALLKALHPDWTPGQIKSALMTTAKEGLFKEDGLTAVDAFDVGSGRVDLNQAAYPGLTISASGQDYVAHQNDLWNANYPSIFVPVFPGRITVERTVHSEKKRPSLWKVWAESPADLKIKLPRWLFVHGGQDKTFKVTIDAREVPLGEIRHASIYMRHGHQLVKLPLSIVRDEPAVTLSTTCEPSSIPWKETTDCSITIANKGFLPAEVDLWNLLPFQLKLIDGSLEGAQAQHNHWMKWISWITYSGTLEGMDPPIVTMSEGASPAGYLPLSAFPSITPLEDASDEFIANYNVPPFVYAGETYTSIGIVSNGYAVVGGGENADVSYINQALPDEARPNNVLAPFWTDLNPGSGGEMRIGILGDGVSDWLILDWEGVVNYGDGLPNSFQIWIGLNGVEDISYTYGDVSVGDGGYLTVGAENAWGNSGENWYLDGSGTPVGPGTELRVISTPGSDPVTHTINFSAKGSFPGEWENCVFMNGNIFHGTNIACSAGEVTLPQR